jgi:hypothetical protein
MNLWSYSNPTPPHLKERFFINPLNAELNPNGHLLAMVGAHHFVHVSRIRVKRRNNFAVYLAVF